MIRLRPSGSGGHVLLAILVALGCAIGPLGAQGRGGAPVYGYEVVKVYPHDREAFTQGLLYRDGVLYESTGLNSRSSLRKVQLETGKVLQQVPVESRYFAEGLTDWGGRLVQLTWNTNIGFVYDLASFKQLQTFSYTGEGWGLARDDRRIIMSDGTSTLRFLDPQTLKVTGQVQVTDGSVPVRDVNELEFIDGQVYANVWLTDRIAMIAPDTGRVTAWINLAGLMSKSGLSGDAVLNGIAYDAQRKRLFVTGKLWPSLFEIRIRR
ncbi:MAG TPA: glutaminyl-peptide cyclotransferase [Vicinamibacterales bacterium]|jgi:glutamine cyclotransferase|nr:glutaminyl-peptide cyclotransferase [Vicinamibacterales bacterium]